MIPLSKSPVNRNKLDGNLAPVKFGTIKMAPNQPADKFINNSAMASSQSASGNLLLEATTTMVTQKFL